ncbi:MAG TPA: glycosyltransferase family 39 protein [Chromatiales bacterium]|nr:glycosyltransferase family 39 protein [Chromatiales bacterium]
MNGRGDGVGWWQLAALWTLLMAVALGLRSFLPIDETRYVTVAWEMWLRGDFLVPHLNGQTYAHKPPLLFWLYQLGWWLFGVNDWWPRLVAPLFGLGSLVLTFSLARRLWPERPEVAGLSVWLLFGSVYWAGYGTAAMFDMLVVFFALLGLLGLWRAGQGEGRMWLLVGLAIGLGILAKGPVILLHILPAALLAPWWSRIAAAGKARWYLHLLGALLLGIAIALAWAVPAALRGGDDYARAIFWGQTANRMVDSFAHRRALWWYLPLLPLIFFPWFWWTPLWKGVRRLARQGPDARVRFCLAWLVPGFVTLSLISGKQVHYLLPLFPAVALLAARGFQESETRQLRLRLPAVILVLFGLLVVSLPWWGVLPEWGAELQVQWALLLVAAGLLLWWWRPADPRAAVRILAGASVLIVISLHLVMQKPLAHAYDLRPVAREIAALQAKGVPLVHESKYAGEYHFLGRLREPLQVIHLGTLERWAREHPDGYIIYYLSRWQKALLPEGCHFWQYYRGQYVTLIPGHFYLDQILPAE